MKKCGVKGCNNKYFSKGYCKKHYQQIRAKGFITDGLPKNSYTIFIDRIYIDLRNKKGNIIAQTVIDINTFDKVKECSWYLSNTNYAQTMVNRKIILLHRFILDIHKEEFNYNNVGEHINGNSLDNRKKNLRVATMQQNSFNRGGVEGVYFNKSRNNWIANITINGERIVKYFDTKEKAIEYRKYLEVIYFGEYKRE